MKETPGFDPADVIGGALRVLKRLAVPGARLERRADYFALKGTGRAGRAMHVPIALVEALRRRDWLTESETDTFALSATGLGWLKRALAGDDPFAAQHGVRRQVETIHHDGTAASVTMNDAESPIGRLHAQMDANGKPLIDDVQYLAGERLRRDFTLANLAPRLAVDLTAPVVAGRRGAGHDELSDIAVAARQRFSRALNVLGPHLADVAVDVCCHLKEPCAAESTQGWSGSAALVVLRIVLDRLAAHYGFVVVGKSRQTRAWRADDEPAADAGKEGGRRDDERAPRRDE